MSFTVEWVKTWFSHTIEYWNETEDYSDYSSVQHGLYFLRMTVTIYPVLHVLSFLDANDMNISSFYTVPESLGFFSLFFFQFIFSLLSRLGSFVDSFFYPLPFCYWTHLPSFLFWLLNFSVLKYPFGSSLYISLLRFFSFSACFRCAHSRFLKHCMMPAFKS